MENTGLTYQQIINQIQLQALNDPTSPASGSQEYNIYTQMINYLAIPTWENERGVLWNELWVDVPSGGTIAVGTTSISLPSDFKFIGSGIVRLLLVGNTTANTNILTMPVKMLPEQDLNPRLSLKEFYVSGNAVNGYELILGWTPQTGDVEIGATVAFRYYKHANQLVAMTDVPEMSDPTYIVYKVAAQVSANNFNLQLYQIFEDKANYSLLNMRMANDMASNFMDDYVKDIDGLLGTNNTPINRMQSGYWTQGGF